MIGTFKKIWEFSGEERGNINKSVAVSFLNAVFHMFEIGAIYFVVMALTNGDKDMKTVWISLAFMVVSIIGNAVTSVSQNYSRHTPAISWQLTGGFLLGTA